MLGGARALSKQSIQQSVTGFRHFSNKALPVVTSFEYYQGKGSHRGDRDKWEASGRQEEAKAFSGGGP